MLEKLRILNIEKGMNSLSEHYYTDEKDVTWFDRSRPHAWPFKYDGYAVMVQIMCAWQGKLLLKPF